jgi:hypothetical protein
MSDIAWFAGGASTDRNHHPTTPGFFPDFDAVHQALPTGTVGNDARKALSEQVMQAVFDLVRSLLIFSFHSD